MKKNSKLVVILFVGLAWPVGAGCQSAEALPPEGMLAEALPPEGMPPEGTSGTGRIPPRDIDDDGTLEVWSSELHGDLGEVCGFSGVEGVSRSNSRRGATQIVTDWVEGHDWMRTLVDVSNLDVLAAPAGRYETNPLDPTAPSVSVFGSSGDVRVNMPTDVINLPSTHAVLSISDEPDSARRLQIEVQFTWPDGRVQETFQVATVREGSQRSLVISGALQSGDLGDVNGYGGDSTRTEGSYSAALSVVRLDAEGPGWWVMNSLHVAGIDLLTAAAGEYRSDDASGVTISAVGCSGPSLGTYTYDQSVDDGEIRIEDGENGERRVVYALTFPSVDGRAAQTSRGSFLFRVSALRRP